MLGKTDLYSLGRGVEVIWALIRRAVSVTQVGAVRRKLMSQRVKGGVELLVVALFSALVAVLAIPLAPNGATAVPPVATATDAVDK